MILYSDRDDHYSQRVRIVLAEKDISAEIIESKTEDVSDEILSISPYHKLPILVDRDFRYVEHRIFNFEPKSALYLHCKVKKAFWEKECLVPCHFRQIVNLTHSFESIILHIVSNHQKMTNVEFHYHRLG